VVGMRGTGAYGVSSWLMLPAPVVVRTSAPGSVESVRDGRTSAAVRYGFVCHVEVQRFKGVGWSWIWREWWWG